MVEFRSICSWKRSTFLLKCYLGSFSRYLCVYFLQWIDGMKAAGATQYTFHYEATDDVVRCIRLIREADMKVICSPICTSYVWCHAERYSYVHIWSSVF